jgi:SH3 domain protein
MAIILCFGGPAVYAQQLFVKEMMKITMRTGPGNDRKILALVSTGQPVEVIETGAEWSHVRLDNGKEGWVLSRFLTPEVPNSISLAKLTKRHDALLTKHAALSEENRQLKETAQRLTAEVQKGVKDLKTLQKEYDTLKAGSADYLKLKTKHQKTSAKLSEQTERAAKFEGELAKLLRKQNIKWFLSGAGVLLLGFIIGYSSKRQRRRSSLL